MISKAPRSLGALALRLGLALAASGCDQDSTSAPPSVSAQKWNPDPGCWALVTGTSAIDSVLGLEPACSDESTSLFAGGADRLRLVIDYGAEVEIDPSTVLPPPTVKMTFDGIEAPIVPSFDPEPRLGRRAYFLATIPAPARRVDLWRISVQGAIGFETSVEPVLAVSHPAVSIEAKACPETADAQCSLVGGVGTTEILITAAGDLSQTVTLRSIINGVTQEDGLRTVTTAAFDARETRKTLFMPVPTAAEGARWELEAELGPSRDMTPPINLAAPLITATIDCGMPCRVEAGAPVALIVTAPERIGQKQALVSTFVDTRPVASATTLNLTVPDVAAGTISGTMPLSAPEDVDATWVIHVSVAGYRAQSIVARVVAEL